MQVQISYRVVKHIQIICQLLLKICLSVYVLFVGLVFMGLKTAIFNFFLGKFHFDALLLCFFHQT